MDFLNQAIAQIGDLFRSMTPGARITTGLLLAVVLISVGYLFQHQSAGPDEFLFGGQYLPDGQLIQVEAAIAEAGLSGYRREGNRILVPEEKKAEYLAAVADAGALPPNFHSYLESALEQGGPWEPAEATRERLKIARQQMLSDIIRHIDWVEEAVVIYDEQQPRGLRREKMVTASVNVKPIAGEYLDPRRMMTLQKLVAHAVVGMRPADVVVTSLGAEGGMGIESVFPEAFENEYHRTRVAYEERKKQQILNALKDIPGVRVEVSAELDNTVLETFQTVTPDKQGTAVRSVTMSETDEPAVDAGGPPGVTAQGPNRQGVTQAAVANGGRRFNKETEDTENIVGQEQTVRQTTGFTPKEDWATVTIPRSYVETIWKQRNPDASVTPKDEDLRTVQQALVTKVEDIVLPLLTRQSKLQDEYKQVKVAIVDSIPLPEIVGPSTAETALAWTGRYWSTLAMCGVAVFSLLILKSVVRGGSPTGPPLASPTLSVHLEEDQTERNGGLDAPERTRLRIKKGVSLKDDLAEMVREDPQAAAAILKSWIGKAG